MKDTFLSEVLATRLSHDLIGNIGAVANATELLNEGDEDDREDISNILNFSSNVLTKRLKFFRLCFGLSNATVKSMNELQDITTGYLQTLGNPNYPISLKLDIENFNIHKLVMPSVMMMADTIIKGGEVKVIQTENSLIIEANSSNNLDNGKLKNIDNVLSGRDIEDNNPSSYAPLFYLLTYLNGSGVNVSLKENRLVIGD
jgi:hypothetical protein